MERNFISLGAGVQSSTLLLMACHGEITPKPEAAIFADTGWEPKLVYTHLEWLVKESEKFGIPVFNIQKGNIREDILLSASGEGGRRFASLPFYTVAKDGTKGMVRRQCTKEYKIEPVRNKMRELLGYAPRKHIKEIVGLWMGISTDESWRVSDSLDPWIVKRYPLIEKGMNRMDCLAWMEQKGYPQPPKSSCIGCPFHDDKHWLRMKQNDPEAFADAVLIDREIKKLPRFKGQAFLHRSCKPLDEVYLQEDQIEIDYFTNECTGHCGV